ncbi:MAG: tetratricopeptide repeat protein [Coriobacteriia bacterium]|nr:tetratricopeptide repeat protein [Coriobacteriia bacterium]
MSDAGPPVEEPIEEIASEKPAAPRSKPSMMADPAVKFMTFAAFGISVLMLLIGIGVLLSGVASPTGPRTLDEKELAVTGEAVRDGKADPGMWGKYIAALIANERYTQAQTVLDRFKASVDTSLTGDAALAEARLAYAREDYKKVIVVANASQKVIRVDWDKRMGLGGMTRAEAFSDGLGENWYAMALVKADAYRAQGDWKNAVKEYDTYIKEFPTAADILVDRGLAKIEAGDKKGAAADFKKALKFIPSDKEALAGLEKIGESKQ